MRKPPAPLQRGPLWLRAKINAVLNFSIQTRPLESETCELDEKLDGTQIRPKAASTTVSSSAPPPPWAIRKVSDTEIRVYRGGVVTPDGTFTPSGFALGDSPSYVLTVSGSGVIYFSATVDDTTGEFLSADNPASGASLPANTDTIKYRELGSFATADDVLTVQSNELGTLSAVMCGGTEIEWNGGA